MTIYSEVGTLEVQFLTNWQAQGEDSALPGATAQADLTVMSFCDGSHQRQAQAAARDAAPGFAAVKFFPDVGLFFARDTGAGVGNFDEQAGAIFGGMQFNGIARAGELEGVFQQVMDSQKEQVGVAGDFWQRPGSLGDGQSQMALAGSGLILGQGKDLLQQGRDIHRGMFHEADFQFSQFPQVG